MKRSAVQAAAVGMISLAATVALVSLAARVDLLSVVAAAPRGSTEVQALPTSTPVPKMSAVASAEIVTASPTIRVTAAPAPVATQRADPPPPPVPTQGTPTPPPAPPSPRTPSPTAVPAQSPIPPRPSATSPTYGGGVPFPSGVAVTTAQYYEGTVSVRLAFGRAITKVLAQYGLPGPAFPSFEPPFTDAEVGAGLDRHYRIKVAVGDERRVVELLAKHPEDVEFVGLVMANIAPSQAVTPVLGARGTTFQLRFCCWETGSVVERILTSPSGKATVLPAMAGDDGTVLIIWTSGAADELGTYEVKVRGGGRAQIFQFRVG